MFNEVTFFYSIIPKQLTYRNQKTALSVLSLRIESGISESAAFGPTTQPPRINISDEWTRRLPTLAVSSIEFQSIQPYITLINRFKGGLNPPHPATQLFISHPRSLMFLDHANPSKGKPQNGRLSFLNTLLFISMTLSKRSILVYLFTKHC